VQAALDYISTELREAVFVYDGTCLSGSVTGCSGVTKYIPTSITNPVLAFWRVDDLPQSLIQTCRNNIARLNDASDGNPIKDVPCLSRRTYSLVVYYLDITNPDGTWRGRARIKRYELKQFNSAGTPNENWADPTSTANNFLGWPFNDKGVDQRKNSNVGTGSDDPVLIDFVDSPTAAATTTACPADGPVNAANSTTSLPKFVRTPTNGSTSFFACVRGGGVDTNPGNRNQEVSLFIRGNAFGQPGVSGDLPFEMETRVLTRGSYAKTPASQ
jgi:hypothetical protein